MSSVHRRHINPMCQSQVQISGTGTALWSLKWTEWQQQPQESNRPVLDLVNKLFVERLERNLPTDPTRITFALCNYVLHLLNKATNADKLREKKKCCTCHRSVSSRPFLCWRIPSMSDLSAGLIPAGTRPGPLLHLWRRSHDQVWSIGVLQRLWSQRWGFVTGYITLRLEYVSFHCTCS